MFLLLMVAFSSADTEKESHEETVSEQPFNIILAKLQYFTNLGFPKIKGIPLPNYHLVWGRARSL